ncbi:YdcH family protein [Cronobacter universalis]|uniref:YdcH family protein n=1 Tax=Cronobacter universalis TaxID=535744 RepID=UPI0024AFD5DD|nr:YdcH family protein [Cronobacter universalis]ELY6246661.1 YdcH family protein [Cronobacter universalis]MDI7660363.1 YdcH family protein [Cronobacter universalis]
MFPEYRELISRLKKENHRFQTLFEKHNALDHEISRLEQNIGSGCGSEIIRLKKEKLYIKDCLYKILIEESRSNNI